MEISRRDLIRNTIAAGGLAAAATALPGVLRGPAFGAPGGPAADTATLQRTYAPGPASNVQGYRPVIAASGEAHVPRAGLGIAAGDGRVAARQGLISFVQLSDVHIIDAQSPLRLEWTDRLDDPSPLPLGLGLFTSSYRAHEMLSGHIADSMVRAINRIGAGPVTGKPLALAIQTGDNSDNSQFNEVRWNIGVLNGGQVRVDSGNLNKYEGVADQVPATYDISYWHPDGAPKGKPVDRPRTEYGFPTVPGLLDAARKPFTAEGLDIPWYSAFGNHDGLVQGNFPANTLQLNLLAIGALKIFSPPTGVNPAALLDDLATNPAALLTNLLGGLTVGVRAVAPDLNRRLLNRKQIVEQHFAMGGAPFGHGFTATNRAKGTAYYSFDQGRFRFIVLDTVNPNGYYDGSLDKTQFAWLQDLLSKSADKIVMVFSHHTSDSMGNPLIAAGGNLELRVTGGAVLTELLAHPQVIAWINGHTHTNKITPRPRPDGGGLWEITTASHIDWPQQARIIEVADNADGTLSIFTTMVDHAGPASYGGNLGDSTHLAALGRELAANDWHGHLGGGGAAEDRNVELLVANPL